MGGRGGRQERARIRTRYTGVLFVRKRSDCAIVTSERKFGVSVYVKTWDSGTPAMSFSDLRSYASALPLPSHLSSLLPQPCLYMRQRFLSLPSHALTLIVLVERSFSIRSKFPSFFSLFFSKKKEEEKRSIVFSKMVRKMIRRRLKERGESPKTVDSRASYVRCECNTVRKRKERESE